MMRTVTIKGVEYNLRYTLRALFIYEELKGEPYSGAKIINNYILLFSMLLANNKDFSLSFNEVIEACDDNPSIFQEFVSVLEAENERVRKMAEHDSDKKKAKKTEKG